MCVCVYVCLYMYVCDHITSNTVFSLFSNKKVHLYLFNSRNSYFTMLLKITYYLDL